MNVNAANAGQDRAAVDYLARKLAKLGVNMVRYHGAAFDKNDPSKVDQKPRRPAVPRVGDEAAGIYTYLSFYFPLWMERTSRGRSSRATSAQNKRPFGLLFFDPRLQEMHRTLARRQLLETKSPYTNLPLGRDPAVGMVEIQNEDSLFFWTFTKKNIPPPQVGQAGGTVPDVAYQAARVDPGRMEGVGRWRATER